MRGFLHPGQAGPPGYPNIDYYGPTSVYATPSHLDLAPPYDQQRAFPGPYGSKEPIYMDDKYAPLPGKCQFFSGA